MGERAHDFQILIEPGDPSPRAPTINESGKKIQAPILDTASEPKGALDESAVPISASPRFVRGDLERIDSKTLKSRDAAAFAALAKAVSNRDLFSRT